MRNDRAERIFGDMADCETIIASCLDGTMGKLLSDTDSAAALLGDFAFFAGLPKAELAEKAASEREFLIAVPQNTAWEKCIESTFGGCAKKVVRCAFRKDTVFDREKLARISAEIPAGVYVKRIDEGLYRKCAESDCLCDLVSNFPSFADYERLGIGFAAVNESGVPVAGASSYSAYKGGIEIEIDTHPDYRRRGLAACLAATLILACLDLGLYPSWDAQNKISAHLAEKLGYVSDREYTAYEVTRQR